MFFTLMLVFWVAILSYAYYNWRCLARNIAAAKTCGLPYVVIPVYTFSTPWLVTHRIWLPYLEKLPKSWTSGWLMFLHPEWAWLHRFEPFEKHGMGALMIVSPAKNQVFVADPEAIHQITTRRNDFPKPIEVYKSVNMYGPNVVGTEGSIWRHHRKITSPPFTEKNNIFVFKESLREAQAMLFNWTRLDGKQSPTISTVAEDTMRLSLHVISRAGFGVRLLWPHEEAVEGDSATSSNMIPAGHTMAYKEALGTLLHNIIWVMLVPHWILAKLPVKQANVAYESFLEWGKYMNEIYQAKKAEIKAGNEPEGHDLMDALVRGAGFTSESLNQANGDGKIAQTKTGNVLSDEEILGNMFVMILAGHETAANTIHYALLFLALQTQSQRHLQSDLDKNGLTTKPIEEWDYEHDVPKLFGGMTGAVMNEELRLIPPVISIPKKTNTPQPLTVSGHRVIIPADTAVNLVTAATHRNPSAWQSNGDPNDLEEFRPERWILHAEGNGGGKEARFDHPTEDEGEDFGGPQGQDTSATLLKPPKGAYLPFSDGPRACLGRRFAQVEVLAVLAVIFREYSVELAVDEWASDEEVGKMDECGRREVWGKAEARARWLMKYGMMSMITIQMREGTVPVRFVKRGGERFLFD